MPTVPSRAFWYTVLVMGVFLAAAHFLSPTSLIENMRVLQAGICLAVFIAYLPHALHALKQQGLDSTDQLSMGLALTFLSLSMTGVWMTLWRLAGKPAWMLDADIQAWMIFLTVVGGSLHITAPGAVNGTVPRRNLLLLGSVCGIGLCLALALLTLNPDFSDIAMALEEYLSPD